MLHRDLKPANIMLNRAGRVLITDFGLAGVAAEFRGADVVAGTPAYMAPEQLQGREVTARSDIYALGLVLYEIFTGTRVFSRLERTAVAAPSLLVKDLSPVIDRIVLACLSEDPQRRPPSAGAIAQALPGADPLAAAMQAGQTPSPEMVAASRATATLGVRGAVLCFAAIVVLLVAAYALIPGRRDIGMAPLDTPPDALVAKARDIAAAAGYDARPRDAAHGFERDNVYMDYLEARGFEWNRIAELRPGTFTWWYRQSPAWLVPRGSSPSVTRADPPAGPGTVEIRLDARSRQLLAFSAVPLEGRGTRVGRTAGTPEGEPDWKPLFEAAGLNPTRFTTAVPGRAPGGEFDLRRAWAGSAAGAPETPVRVEAAALDGRAVSFVLSYPWTDTHAASVEPSATTTAGMPAVPVLIGIMCTVIIAASFLVRRNYRLGRVDLRGAGTLAGAVFWLTLVAWLLRAHLSPTADTFARLTQAIGASLFTAGVVFIAYAGIDPYARRYWPTSLVSWTRLVNGRLRDPLVGQDILIGLLAGLATTAGFIAYCFAGAALNARPASAIDGFRVIDIALPRMLARSADAATFALFTGAGGFVVLLPLKALLRRNWLVMIVWSLSGGMTWWPALGPSYPLLAITCMSVSFIPSVWAYLRYGMLPVAVATWVFIVATLVPTWDLTLWYGPPGLANGLFILALAAYGLRVALGGRQVFGRDFSG